MGAPLEGNGGGGQPGSSGGRGRRAAAVPGLARFEPDDHALFFGRDRLAAAGARAPVAVLFGASGSGKSSLVRAPPARGGRPPGPSGGAADPRAGAASGHDVRASAAPAESWVGMGGSSRPVCAPRRNPLRRAETGKR
ncbi:hypothetical protein [Streptomyces sp. ST1020]|uniref:nSTAND1 domain-containing NTPase n=1 Tax=Streptomyces sp. ST1015 TaxID=1848900 RepID=UPI0031F2FC41